MGDLHTLRAPGRARGVNHISQRRRADFNPGLDGRTGGIGPVPLVQVRHREVRYLNYLRQLTVRQQRTHPRVRHHHLQTLRRIAGVQRHVRAPALQHPEHADQHVRRALDADPHQIPGTHAAARQVVRDRVRAAVQLTVGQTLSGAAHRDRIGGTRHLTLEQSVQRRIARIRGGRIVPAVQLLPAFLLVEHRETGHRGLRGGDR